MEDLFKKFLYTGVGFVALTAEKLQEAIDELVGKGKISKDEGKKILDDFFDSTDAKKEEFESKLRETAEGVISKFSVPSKAEFDAMAKKIEELEAKLASMETKKTTTRKTSARKTTTRKSTAKKPSDSKAKEE